MKVQLIDAENKDFLPPAQFLNGESIEFAPNETGEEVHIVSYRLIPETSFEESWLKNAPMPVRFKNPLRVPSSDRISRVPVLKLRINFGKCSFE